MEIGRFTVILLVSPQMKRIAGLVLGLLCSCASALPGAAPAPSWLPPDTIFLLSIPNGDRLRERWMEHPLHDLAGATAMRPAWEQLSLQLRTGMVARAEQKTGIPLSTLASLVQGQFTLAMARNRWTPGGTNTPALLLLADVGDLTGKLRRCLAEIRQNWAEKGLTVGTIQIHGQDFLRAELPRAATWRGLGFLWNNTRPRTSDTNPPPASSPTTETNSTPPPDRDRLPLLLGQVSSFLLAGTDEEVLGRALDNLVQTDPPTNTLATAAEFTRPHQSFLKDSDGFLWLDLRPAGEILKSLALLADADPEAAKSPIPMPKRTTILSASGLLGLRALSVGWREISEGSMLELDVGAPQEERAGLLKLFETETKDASPPGFIPTNAVAFERIRVDLSQSVRVLEQMFTNVFPQAEGVLKFLLQTAGQDPHGNIDLRHELLSSLGDDIIRYQWTPSTNGSPTAAPPASLLLVGSTNAANLLKTLLSLSILLPSPFNEAQENVIAGRTVCILPMTPADPQASARRELFLSEAPGFLVVASDAALLGAPTNLVYTNHPLSAQPRLAQAAASVGGMQQGWFAYEDLSVTLRSHYDQWRHQGVSFRDWPVVSALADFLDLQSNTPACPLDLSRLPPFEEVAHYLPPLLRAARTDASGFHGRVLWMRPEKPPAPPPSQPAPPIPPPEPPPLPVPTKP